MTVVSAPAAAMQIAMPPTMTSRGRRSYQAPLNGATMPSASGMIVSRSPAAKGGS